MQVGLFAIVCAEFLRGVACASRRFSGSSVTHASCVAHSLTAWQPFAPQEREFQERVKKARRAAEKRDTHGKGRRGVAGADDGSEEAPWPPVGVKVLGRAVTPPHRSARPAVAVPGLRVPVRRRLASSGSLVVVGVAARLGEVVVPSTHPFSFGPRRSTAGGLAPSMAWSRVESAALAAITEGMSRHMRR